MQKFTHEELRAIECDLQPQTYEQLLEELNIPHPPQDRTQSNIIAYIIMAIIVILALATMYAIAQKII